jgi:hypothetical protein
MPLLAGRRTLLAGAAVAASLAVVTLLAQRAGERVAKPWGRSPA